MKRIITFIICMYITSVICNAQSYYRSLVENGKIWKGVEIDNTGHRYQCNYFIDGDTLLGEDVYFKLYNCSERLDNDSISRYIGALREIDKKVYGVPANFNSKVLLFDFSMDVGDYAYCHMYYSPMGYQGMSDIGDQILFWGIDYLTGTYSNIYYTSKHSCYLKLQSIAPVVNDEGSFQYTFLFDISYETEDPHVEYQHSTENVYWLEGIGEGKGYPFRSWDLFGNKDLMYDRFHSFLKYELEECSVHDKVLYSRAGTAGIHPSRNNGVNSEVDVFYDLQGRILQGPPQKGFYLRKGKKYIE